MTSLEPVLARAEQAAADDADAAARGTPSASLRWVVREELRRAWQAGWEAGYADGAMDQTAARLALRDREQEQT